MKFKIDNNDPNFDKKIEELLNNDKTKLTKISFSITGSKDKENKSKPGEFSLMRTLSAKMDDVNADFAWVKYDDCKTYGGKTIWMMAMKDKPAKWKMKIIEWLMQ